MKKLIVALAMVAFAAYAQAAVVKWGTDNNVSFKGSNLGNQSVSLYIVGVGGAADVLVDTRTTVNNPVAQRGKLGSNYGAGQNSYDYNSTIAGGALWTTDDGDLGRQYYMVITYNDGTTDYTYTSSAVASSGLSSTALGTVSFTFTDTIKASGTDGWVAAPEPTSGLLMLLGFAGLALRRRRA